MKFHFFISLIVWFISLNSPHPCRHCNSLMMDSIFCSLWNLRMALWVILANGILVTRYEQKLKMCLRRCVSGHSFLFFHYESITWVATGPKWNRPRPHLQLEVKPNWTQTWWTKLPPTKSHESIFFMSLSWRWFVPCIFLAIAKWSTVFGKIRLSKLERGSGNVGDNNMLEEKKNSKR